MKAPREKVAEAGKTLEIQGRAIAALSPTGILTDLELHLAAKALLDNALTLVEWTRP